MKRIKPINWRFSLWTAVTTTAAVVTLLSCSDSTSPDKSGKFFGPPVAVANGTARGYVILDAAGAPKDLGVALTETVMTGLPAAHTEFVIELPTEASMTVYKHVTINWQPTGHGPGAVYALPHFDMHVYMITQADRAALVLGTAELSAKMARQPSAEFVSAGYAPLTAIPQMGLHWNDLTAPERNGEVFTKTFFYGSYDGVFMLHEPMVTKAFLETKRAPEVTPIKLPAQFATHGYQATSYTAGYDASTKEYLIALSGLINR